MDSRGPIPALAILGTLGLLPEPAGRLRSFISSLVLNVSIGVLLLWLTVIQLRKTPVPPRYVTTQLIYPSKLPPQHKKLPPPHPAVELPRKIETQLPKPEPVKPVVVRMETPAMPTMPSAPAATVAAPAPPKVGSFAGAKQSIVQPTLLRMRSRPEGSAIRWAWCRIQMHRARQPLLQLASSKTLLVRDKEQSLRTPAWWQQADLVPDSVTHRKKQAREEEPSLPGASAATERAAAPLQSPGSSGCTSVPLKSCRNLVRNTRKRRGNYGSRAKSPCKFALASTANWRFCASSPVLAMALIKRLRWLPSRSGLNLQ
jgi:hypothetical protein